VRAHDVEGGDAKHALRVVAACVDRAPPARGQGKMRGAKKKKTK
jgi:hypothetical protein